MTFKDTVEQITKTIEDAKKDAEKALVTEFSDVFQRHPEIKCITWTQYTPYFNDGYACTFRVNDIYASNYEECSHWGEWDDSEDEPDDFEVYSSYDLSRNNKLKDIADLFDFMSSSIGEEILEFAFGDHVKVKVTQAGVETDDYDHD